MLQVAVQIDKAIKAALEEFEGEVMDTMAEIVPDLLKDAQKQLKKASPQRSGEYAKGWKVQTEKTRTGVSGVLYNAKKPGLTHLLENGHAKRGGGRTTPQEHIAPVNDWVADEAVKRIEEAMK